jgi:hypothetical protein
LRPFTKAVMFDEKGGSESGEEATFYV